MENQSSKTFWDISVTKLALFHTICCTLYSVSLFFHLYPFSIDTESLLPGIQGNWTHSLGLIGLNIFNVWVISWLSLGGWFTLKMRISVIWFLPDLIWEQVGGVCGWAGLCLFYVFYWFLQIFSRYVKCFYRLMNFLHVNCLNCK